MADKLDKAISEKRAYVDQLANDMAKLRRMLDIAKAELSGLEAAASYRPAPETPRRKGRQPGAISNEWRHVLAVAHLVGPQSYQDLANVAIASGMDADMANVRERVRTFVKAGLMEGSPEAGFTVTKEAIDRFGFDRPEPSIILDGGTF